MTFQEYYKQVSRKVELSALDMSAEEVDEVVEDAYKSGMTVKQCAEQLSESLDFEAPDRFMIGAHG